MDDRGEIGRAWRIGLVVNELEPVLLDDVANALRGVSRELGILGEQSQGLRFRVGCQRNVEEWLGVGMLRVGPHREHREIFRIVELAVDREPEQAEEHFVMRNRDRHRRRDLVGAVARNDEVDFVDVEHLGVDARHRRRVRLVVVVDQLDRPAQQAALGVDLVLPDLHRQQGRFAAAGEPAGQRHAEADRDRLRRLYCTRCQHARSQPCGRGADRISNSVLKHLLPSPFACSPLSRSRRQSDRRRRNRARGRARPEPSDNAGGREPRQAQTPSGADRADGGTTAAADPPRSAG